MAELFRKLKKKFKRSREKESLGSLLLSYLILIGIGFIYLYPILYMICNSFMSELDLSDPSVTWIPKSLSLDNFKAAFVTLDFVKSFRNSLIMSFIPALLQTVSASVIGYGFAKFSFPLKKLWLAFIVATFLFPSQFFFVPRYAMYHSMNILNTVFPSYLPALFGQGIRSAIFILVFYMFFTSYPKAYDEAAKIDGANSIMLYRKIALPMSRSAIVLTYLFSLVWYWNETNESTLYFGQKIATLPMQLANFAAKYSDIFGRDDAIDTVSKMTAAIPLSGTFLSVLPLVLIYILLQRQFVESIERVGITGE